jgi:hypothetical protein
MTGSLNIDLLKLFSDSGKGIFAIMLHADQQINQKVCLY